MKKNYFLAVFITLLCMSCGTKIRDAKTKDISCFEYSGRPSQALKYKEVVSMLKHYDNTRVEALKRTNNGKEDTRENYYPLEDLKAYIAYVEKLSKEKKIKITGINIINAAYPDDTSRYPVKANYQTLIFMPATSIGNEKNVSFDPLHSKIGKPKRFDEILKKFNYFYRQSPQKNKMILKASNYMGDDMESSAANRAKISPPY
jgi:hypothetical protein